MIVTLAEAKAHLGIAHDRLDDFVTGLLAAAEDACLRFIDGLEEGADAPDILKAAIKMHLAALFEGREGAAIPEEAQSLLRDLRPWTFGGCE